MDTIAQDNIFGERLRLLRKLSAYKSQKEFAQALGIPQPTLSYYESGKVKPTVDALINIADKLDTSIDWLCGRSEGFQIKSFSAVLGCFFELLEIEEVSIYTDLDGKKATDIHDSVEFKISEKDLLKVNKQKSTIGLCDSMLKAYKLTQDLRHYEISQDTYEREKQFYIDQLGGIPLTKVDHSGISEEEQRKRMLEFMKQELEAMNNK